MDQIKDPPNSDLQILFLSMPPSVRVIFNDGVGGCDFSGAVRDYEGREGVQNLLLDSMYSFYDVALFGHGRSNV